MPSVNAAIISTTASVTQRAATASKDSEGRHRSPEFIGKFKQTRSRLAAKPMVDYKNGGSDFRTYGGSSIGRQIEGLAHMRSGSRASLGTAPRFSPSHTVGPGPSMAPVSAIGRQIQSRRANAGTMSFGTSTRSGALKLYATYTAKR